MSGSMALRSRRVLIDDALRPATIVVTDGRITAVTADTSGLPARDLGDQVLMPALIDFHVHVNEPGRTEWEGFITATQAAAGGGIAVIVDMPLNCIPVTTTRDAFAVKVREIAGKLWVDAGFWGGVVPGNSGELAGMAEDGVLGFKCFLTHSGIDDFPNATAADLRVAMPILAKAGVPLLVHAELDSAITGPPPAGDPREYATYLHSRPREMEDAAIALIVDLVRETGCRAHIVHLSSASALPILAAAKREGLPITAETCPHYLCLRAEDVPDGATAFKCAPPIREDANREGLWKGLADGTIDFVISDHSPCTPHLKLPERGDFIEAWGGIASLQLGLPNIWTEASRRGFDLRRVARWMSAGPAAFLGLPGRSGRIEVGAVADLVAWEPSAEFAIRPEMLLHRHKISPYVGKDVRGRVTNTWVRGEAAFVDGRPVDQAVGRPILRA